MRGHGMDNINVDHSLAKFLNCATHLSPGIYDITGHRGVELTWYIHRQYQ